MFIARVVAFTLALLLLSENIEPTPGWYVALWLACMLSFSLLSLIGAAISLSLAIGVFDPAESWHVVLVVFTLIALLRGLINRPASVWRAGSFSFRQPSRDDV
jgi:hypothetical protein